MKRSSQPTVIIAIAIHKGPLETQAKYYKQGCQNAISILESKVEFQTKAFIDFTKQLVQDEQKKVSSIGASLNFAHKEVEISNQDKSNMNCKHLRDKES